MPHVGAVGWEARGKDEPKDGMEIGCFIDFKSGKTRQRAVGANSALAGVTVMREQTEANTNTWQGDHGSMVGIWEGRKARPGIAASPGRENGHRATEG